MIMATARVVARNPNVRFLSFGPSALEWSHESGPKVARMHAAPVLPLRAIFGHSGQILLIRALRAFRALFGAQFCTKKKRNNNSATRTTIEITPDNFSKNPLTDIYWWRYQRSSRKSLSAMRSSLASSTSSGWSIDISRDSFMTVKSIRSAKLS